MANLSGKVAFITGGSRGIGLAIAHRFQNEGAVVAITGTSQAHLDAAARELGDSAVALRADVRRYDEVEAAISSVASKYGGLDILVNNAGVGVFKPVDETTVDDW